MKKLSYHHIVERSKGGSTTIENGALLSIENHAWFHQQSEEDQIKMNKAFQAYKACKVVLVDNLDLPFQINFTELVVKDRKKSYDRNKNKKEFQRRIKDFELGDD